MVIINLIHIFKVIPPANRMTIHLYLIFVTRPSSHGGDGLGKSEDDGEQAE